jgi:hypothetical protein
VQWIDQDRRTLNWETGWGFFLFPRRNHMKDEPYVTTITWDGLTFWSVTLMAIIIVVSIWWTMKSKDNETVTVVQPKKHTDYPIFDWSREETDNLVLTTSTDIANEIIRHCVDIQHDAYAGVCTRCFEAATIATKHGENWSHK